MNVLPKEQCESRIIQSKFGAIEINPERALYFPYGILGFPEQTSYCLVACPVEKFSSFLILQSTEEDDLCFMVKPIDINSGEFVKTSDLEEAYGMVGINNEEVAVVLIASTKETENGKRITLNCKAPIFIDMEGKAAMQFVLQNSEYETQRIL